MNFAHPELLWLAPLVALPVIIHLLNRLRYRRVRWAAIEFLLTSEQKAMRRARLRQILLMLLRVLLLTAALGALAQPMLTGGLAALLGGSTQVAVALDASASMAARRPTGSAFEVGKRLAAQAIAALPRATTAIAGSYAGEFRCAFAQPLQDKRAVVSELEGARRTACRGNVPAAIRAAAEALRRGGGGGVIWLLSDLQASDWRLDDTGEWQQALQALTEAGKPRLIVTDLGEEVQANFSVAGLAQGPAVPVEGDAPTLTATINFASAAGGGGVTTVALFFDGRRVDSRTIEPSGPGKRQVVFRLPPLTKGTHAGRLELSADALPADNTYHFVVRAAERIPLAVVDGGPSGQVLGGAGDFVMLALAPSPQVRSPYAPRRLRPEELAAARVEEFAAIIVAGVERLAPEAAKKLSAYVEAGGLLVVFPPPRGDAATWNDSGLVSARLSQITTVSGEKRLKLGQVAPNNPLVATLPAEGLDSVLIGKLWAIQPGPASETLVHTEDGKPFLLREQKGKGRAYLFATTAQVDFSNLPLTPPFLLLLHRVVGSHVAELLEPLSHLAGAPVKLRAGEAVAGVIAPDNRRVAFERRAGEIVVAATQAAGVYHAESAGRKAPLFAVNVPPEESELERVTPERIRELLPAVSVDFTDGSAARLDLATSAGSERAALSFPLALAALGFLIGEVALALSITARARTAAKTLEAET